jgi:hypothetical protein
VRISLEDDRIDGYLQLVFNRELALQKSEKATWRVELNKEKKSAIVYENASALIDIFSSLNSGGQKEAFLGKLHDNLAYREEEYAQYGGDRWGRAAEKIVPSGLSAICFYTLLQLGQVDLAIGAFNIRVGRGNCVIAFALLKDIFREDYNYFTIQQLNKLSENFYILKGHNEGMVRFSDELLSYITENGFRILKQEIKGVNIEINRDKESVIQKMGTLGFGKEYELFLNELDVYIINGSGIVASGMISNFRSFWEKIIIELAKKVAARLKTSVPKVTDSAVGNARAFIKSQLGLSDSDHSLISRFVDVLNTEGGHAFISSIEYFRLTRNIGIEILLLLLSKMEGVKA